MIRVDPEESNHDQSPTLGDFLGPRSCTVFFLKLACRCCSRSRIGIVFEQRLTVLVVFGSLVLVNWDRLIFFDPDASRPANFIDLTLPSERARDSQQACSLFPRGKWAGRIHRELEQQSLGAFSECDWVTVMDWK